MLLDWRGAGVLGLIAAGVLWYTSRKVGDAVEGAVDGLVKFGDAINFDTESMGPPAELSDPAQLSQQDYIDRGYLEVLPDGRTRITDAGNRYIESQQRGQVNE